MLTPRALLDHARRLLTANPDEADARRAISACYYAIFDLFITEAASLQPGSADVQDSIRRSMQHREVRRVCDAVRTRFGARPPALQQLLQEPVDPALVTAADVFAELQEARYRADYDLTLTVSPVDAVLALSAAQTVLDTWPTLLPDPNTRTFLLALLFHDRWTRRP